MNYQISDILSNPALINKVSDEVLQDWITRYPYVSLFHLYALKRKHDYSEKELHKTAFYINNRSKLYFLLQKETNTSLPLTQVQEIENSNATDKQNTNEAASLPISKTTSITEDDMSEIAPIIISPTEASTEVKPLTIADQILAEIKLRQSVKEQESEQVSEVITTAAITQQEHKVENPTLTVDGELKQTSALQDTTSNAETEDNAETVTAKPDTIEEKKISIAEKVFGAIQQMKEETPVTIERVEQITLHPPTEKQESLAVAKEEIQEAKGIPVISNEITPEPTPKAIQDTDNPHTFMEWLKLLGNDLNTKTIDPAADTSEWIEIPRYEVELLQEIKKEEEHQPISINLPQQENKLFEPNFDEGEVDLFHEIDEEVNKVASESVSFKQDMMTETLAKIYEKQGKTDKAIEIYNALSMKFPEKSAYFAVLIKKIEKGE